MQIDVIDNLTMLNELRANWESVYEADPEAQYFLSWTWLSWWLKGRDRDQWFILAAKPDASMSNYVAFFPLNLRTEMRDEGGFYNLISPAAGPFADYTGFLCASEFCDRAIPAFAEHIKRLNWTALELHHFCHSDERRFSERR